MFTIAVNGSYPKTPEPPRPPLLQRAIDDYENGRITDRELERAKDRATVEAVAEMVAAGVEVVSDGQIRWNHGAMHICHQLGGFTGKEEVKESDNGSYKPRAVDRIKWTHPIIVDDHRFITERSPVEVRPVLTGPFSLARICNSGIYEDDIHSFTNDIALALNREILGLEAAGAKYILIEEPELTFNKDEIANFIEAAFLLCDKVETKVILGTSGGDILGIETELSDSPFHGIALDMLEGPENERAFFDEKRFSGRILQFGLINSYDQTVERPQFIANYLMRLAQHHDPELIWVAPTGGLSSLPRDIAFVKLKCLYTGVQRARRELTRLEKPGGSLPDDSVTTD
ncbi:hypothetical protein HQ587_09795 [bacterium]|nr:hypothetical protein [bacterium]